MVIRKFQWFVDYYNNRQYHESLDNLTPADIYAEREREIISKRENIKRKTMMRIRVENLVGCYEAIF
jgi:hypothetical protein